MAWDQGTFRLHRQQGWKLLVTQETPLSPLWGLSPTQFLPLAELEHPRTPGSAGPTSPACGTLVCSSFWGFFCTIDLENQTKTQLKIKNNSNKRKKYPKGTEPSQFSIGSVS